MPITPIIAIILLALTTACAQFDTSYSQYPVPTEFEESLTESAPGRWVHTGDHGVYLLTHPDGPPWVGEVDTDDEPAVGYCGPTAMINVLFWYGIDISYEDAARAMRLRAWRPKDARQSVALCATVCGLEPACSAACYLVVKRELSALGTNARDAVRAIKRAAPEGYRAVSTSDDPSQIVEIIWQLVDGNPVVVGEYIGGLHLSVLTGIQIDPDTGELWVIMANSYHRPLDEFMRAWSLRDFGPKAALKVGRRRSGIKPFMAVWYEKEGE